VFTTSLWGAWTEGAWRAVAAIDATGHVPAASGPGAGFSAASPVSQAAAVAVRVADDEPLAAFWTKAEKDEEFAGRLLAAL
jgi:hypothetical protein